ncbi:type III-B CRISPR module-associated protein Cmr3 [Candidatus Viridilinea mediisalina]|uniref:CRISPR-associated protein Cmr3 n=1 Tax=Candidatus Viridilinea mediisalina TaxID=2024553 RepID=A0A2A6RP77_9CHLR|nr:type III-B CRISPR module-associated protein Cmr3 [Candidatus Viridilinea mediisalina]PDW04678.1 hypothetical protein CJ255_02560 [Candidatus Viridilinea mediisalina]
MPTWIIEPHDPLIVRDGRPFGPDPGVRAVSLAFPLPSTTTGAARTCAGLNAQGQFDPQRIAAVKQLAVRGPLLVELDENEDVAWYAPAPSDALMLASEKQDDTLAIRRLVPLALPTGATTDLEASYSLVGRRQREKAKVSGQAPQFWHWNRFEQWLVAPQDDDALRASDLGLAGLLRDSRMHVQINAQRQTAKQGALFQTVGLSFTTRDRRRLALLVEVAQPFPHFAGGMDSLAGERRLVTWRQSAVQLPTCPAELREAIIRDGACRVVLLTPAIFRAGFRPERLLRPAYGVAPRLVAAAVARTQVVSGWDLQVQKPKPTRRMAPAGSVYFLMLEGSPSARAAWLDAHWMAVVSDDEQDARDGFGLMALGVWDGALQAMGEDDARS